MAIGRIRVEGDASLLSIPGILLGLKDELGDTLALGAANETEQDEEILNILTSLPLWNW